MLSFNCNYNSQLNLIIFLNYITNKVFQLLQIKKYIKQKSNKIQYNVVFNKLTIDFRSRGGIYM